MSSRSKTKAWEGYKTLSCAAFTAWAIYAFSHLVVSLWSHVSSWFHTLPSFIPFWG